MKVLRGNWVNIWLKCRKPIWFACKKKTIQEMSREIIRSLGVGNFLEWGAMSARGAFKGVLIFWGSRVVELLDTKVSVFSVSVD